MRARLCGTGEVTLMFLLRGIQYEAPVIVNVIGILAFEAAPGLNRQRLNALTVALSKMAFPVLCAMVALVTFPLVASTSTTQTPLPVT